jgi:hypothetical protein
MAMKCLICGISHVGSTERIVLFTEYICTVAMYSPYVWSLLKRLATGSKVWGSNPSGGRDFQNPSRPALGPTQPPIKWVPGHSQGKTAGTWRWPPAPSSAEVKNRVELFLYYSNGPTWQVIGWTLTTCFCLLFDNSFSVLCIVKCKCRGVKEKL